MAGMPWIIGADWVDNAARNGWHGCVGETRIIDRPTTPDEWLTQRADLSGFTVAQAPERTVGADEPVVFAGAGFPGAEVRTTPGDATTVVAADGTWQLEITEGLVRGTNSFELVQALGTRAGTPVAVEFEVEPFAVAVTASSRSLAGKKYVSVVATNNDSVPVDIVIDTAYGSKTFTAVAPGKSASVSINSRLTSVPAGTASVAVTGAVDGETITMTKLAAYPAG
jgi:hypothetical protein